MTYFHTYQADGVTHCDPVTLAAFRWFRSDAPHRAQFCIRADDLATAQRVASHVWNGGRFGSDRVGGVVVITPAPQAPRDWCADLPAGRWRDGRPFAAGVQLAMTERDARTLADDWNGQARPMTGAELTAVASWSASAAPVEAVTLHDGPEVQHLVPGVAAVPLLARQLADARARVTARRGHAPLPAGGLWDETAINQQELFA